MYQCDQWLTLKQWFDELQLILNVRIQYDKVFCTSYSAQQIDIAFFSVSTEMVSKRLFCVAFWRLYINNSIYIMKLFNKFVTIYRPINLVKYEADSTRVELYLVARQYCLLKITNLQAHDAS